MRKTNGHVGTIKENSKADQKSVCDLEKTDVK